MHLKYRNVNDAFGSLVTLMSNDCQVMVESSRNGRVRKVPEPVLIEYSRPQEMVLLNQARDVNPFMMMAESLWTLAGRNDVATLRHFAEGMSNYSDDGVTLNGAYGYRWRQSRPVLQSTISEFNNASGEWGSRSVGPIRIDQLQILINHLKLVSDSRRAVLQMWNVEDDLLKIGPENLSRDICCNTEVLFSVQGRYLDMTVINRSNDLIWGTLGSDYVNFAMLQEYMACSVGVAVGRYYQFTNNLHAYVDSHSKFDENAGRWLEWYAKTAASSEVMPVVKNRTPLVKDQAAFDKQVGKLVDCYNCVLPAHSFVDEPFLAQIAAPMISAFNHHKERNYQAAVNCVDLIKQEDWQWVARKWIEKRRDNWLKKGKVE